MKLSALSDRKYFVFLILLIIYLVVYSILEAPYLHFLYFTSFDNLIDKDSNKYLSSFFLWVKTEGRYLYNYVYVIFIIKLLGLPLLLVDSWRRVGAILILGINLVFVNLSYTTSPELKYINLLFLIIAFYPQVFNFKKDQQITFSSTFITIIWFSFGLSYFLSGYYKLISPDWFYGFFMQDFARSNHNFNESFSFLLNYPELLRLATFYSMIAELTALPLALFEKTRIYALISLTVMQLGLLLLADVYQITLGMLVFHVFMFLTLKLKLRTMD